MKSVYLIPTLAVALAGFAGSASAQDFDGPSIGVQAGWSQSKVNDPTTDAGVAPIKTNRDSFVGGAFVGYDKQIASHFVLGAEAGFSIAADDGLTQSRGGVSASIDPKYSFDLTARAGYIVAPRTLLYVRSGYVNERVSSSITDAAGTRTAHDNLDGWTVGGGVERVLFDKVSARLEYRYADLSDGNSGQFDRHQVLVGAAYRF